MVTHPIKSAVAQQLRISKDIVKKSHHDFFTTSTDLFRLGLGCFCLNIIESSLIFTNKIFIQSYVSLILFIGFKIIFNYQKCTISYIECKLRGVKKEKTSTVTNHYLGLFKEDSSYQNRYLKFIAINNLI